MMCTAIVLTAYSQHRFLLFDHRQGLSTVYVPAPYNAGMYVGLMFTYECISRPYGCYAQYVTYTGYPARWAASDIWFLHHVIDILRYMLCYRQPEPSIFHLVSQLYRPVDVSIERARFMLLARLFFLTGVQPEEEYNAYGIMYTIAEHSFHDLITSSAYTEEHVAWWVSLCAAICNTYVPLTTRTFYTIRGLA